MAISHPTRLHRQALSKAAVYPAIADLNLDLDRVVEDFRRLRELRFRREFMDAFIVKVEDLRCWANGELLETQNRREMSDWLRWERLNSRFDKRYRDPNDVLIEADLIRKQRVSRRKAKRTR